MRVWSDRNSTPQWIPSWKVVFDQTGVLSCFCFTVFSFSVARLRVRFTPSACHSCEELIVKFFALLIHLIAQFQSAVVVICLITACYPAFDQSAWLHYLRQRKAAAFSCITQKQGVMSDETRKTGSNPARGKSLTRYCSVLFLDGPHYAALFAATRHAPGEVPLSAGANRKTTERRHI
jgi:hypothetical protein